MAPTAVDIADSDLLKKDIKAYERIEIGCLPCVVYECISCILK